MLVGEMAALMIGRERVYGITMNHKNVGYAELMMYGTLRHMFRTSYAPGPLSTDPLNIC